MRELSEKELNQVSGGYGYYAGGKAEAGSIADLKKGTYGSSSSAGVVVTPLSVVAGAGNMTLATGKFFSGVSSGASASGEVVL